MCSSMVIRSYIHVMLACMYDNRATIATGVCIISLFFIGYLFLISFHLFKMPKGKCKWSDSIKTQHPYLQKGKTENTAFCTKCNCSFSIAGGGNFDADRHAKTAKHEGNMRASANSSITAHFESTLDFKRSAQEGVWAYHIVSSNHSFASSDCASKIFRECFGIKKFTCSQSKCRAIVANVLAPHAEEIMANELKESRFITLYTDASNHGAIKIFPVMGRYFRPLEGLCVKILDVVSMSEENSAAIVDLLTRNITKYGLEKKLAGFSGDNAKVNFGGVTRGGHNNVFSRLKATFPHLVGVGCAAHIEHNTLKRACDILPFDIEWLIVKTYSHFYRYTCRVEALRQFCEEAEQEYFQVLGYAKTRFLALGPAVERIILLFDVLRTYFLSLPKGEKPLKDFYADKSSKFWLMFIQEQVSV